MLESFIDGGAREPQRCPRKLNPRSSVLELSSQTRLGFSACARRVRSSTLLRFAVVKFVVCRERTRLRRHGNLRHSSAKCWGDAIRNGDIAGKHQHVDTRWARATQRRSAHRPGETRSAGRRGVGDAYHGRSRQVAVLQLPRQAPSIFGFQGPRRRIRGSRWQTSRSRRGTPGTSGSPPLHGNSLRGRAPRTCPPPSHPPAACSRPAYGPAKRLG